MTAPTVAFVASNDTQVEMFAPVMAELDRRSVRCVLGSLDSLYHQGASLRAIELGLPASEIAPEVVVHGSFFRRPTIRIWRDVARARRPASSWLKLASPQAIVLGNDRGLIEKLLLDRARRQGIPTLLVQDGTLDATGPRMYRPGAHVRRALRTSGSHVLRAVGLGYLGASQYGCGGADVLCASGPHGARVFEQLGIDRARITITGQPRFDQLRAAAAAPFETRPTSVVMFTTPFEAAGIGIQLQRRQLELAAGLARGFTGQGVQFHVKPHPREVIGDYERMLDDPRMVLVGRPSEILAGCMLVVAGTSTVVDEAALAGVPVIVPGRFLHSPRLEHQLPPPAAYPRFETASDGIDLALHLLGDPADGRGLLKRQQATVAERVHLDPDRSAASLVADAVASLVLR